MLSVDQYRNHFQQDRQCTYKVILRRVSATTVVAEKQYVSVTHSGCGFLVLAIQQATRMRRILSCVTCPAVPCFSTLSKKWHAFRKKKIFNIKCVFWVSLYYFSETSSTLRRIQWPTITNLRRSSCKVRYTLWQILMKLIFSRQGFAKYSNIKFNEIPYIKNRVFPKQTDGQTEMTKLFNVVRTVHHPIICI